MSPEPGVMDISEQPFSRCRNRLSRLRVLPLLVEVALTYLNKLTPVVKSFNEMRCRLQRVHFFKPPFQLFDSLLRSMYQYIKALSVPEELICNEHN